MAISFVVPIGLLAVTPHLQAGVQQRMVISRGLLVVVHRLNPISFNHKRPGDGRSVQCGYNPRGHARCSGEPFKITSIYGTGTLVPTVLEIHLTGVRNSGPGAIIATIGTIATTATLNITTDQPGFDEIDIILPATVDTGPNLTLVVTVTPATSREIATAPLIRIDP